MAITINTAEGGTPTSAVTTSDGVGGTAWSAVTPGATGSIAYTADAYYDGKVAIEIDGKSGETCYLTRSTTNHRGGALTMWFKLAAIPSGVSRLASSNTSGGTRIAAVCVSNDGGLFRESNDGNIGSITSTKLATGVWYRLEWSWSNPSTSTGTCVFDVYLGNNTTPISGLSSSETTLNNGTSNAAQLRVGKQTSSGTFGPVVVDNVAYDDGALTPPTVAFPNPDDHYVAVRGRAANTSSGSTTEVDLADGAAITTGNYLIARIAVDNSGTSGAAPDITSIVDDASNTWTVVGPANQDPGAANAGITCYLAYTRVVNAYSNGHDIDITWTTGSPAAKAIVVEEWGNIDATTPVAVSAATNTGSGTSLSVGITPTASDQLIIGCAAVEGPAGDTFTLDSDATDGTWRALEALSTDHATAATNATVRGVCKRVTGTSAQTWNATITSRDWAGLAVVFDIPAPPDEPTPLATPDNFTFAAQPGERRINSSWTPVDNAAGYELTVEILAEDGDPDVPEDWSVHDTYVTEEAGLSIDDDPEGIDWDRTYGGTLVALAELPE